MSARDSTSTADVAARQVERIVEAAQEAATSIRDQAREELELARQQAERDRERVRAEAKRDGERELNESRKQATALAQDARRDAEAMVEDAQRQAAQLREQTRRAVEGRVSGARQAADEVLAEAEALSGGMRQLGATLSAQADRMLRDVQAAHKRMQADLRIGPSDAPGGRVVARAAATQETGDTSGEAPARSAPRVEGGASDDSGAEARSSTPARRRANPFEDIDPPSWVARER